MSVGRVGGGGKGGRAGGPKGAGPAGPAGGPSKTSGAKGYSQVDRVERLVGPSGTAGSSNVGASAPADVMTSRVMEIVRAQIAGQIGTREEAMKKIVDEILQKKLRLKSKALTSKIVEQMQDDPELTQRLERLWSKG